MKYRPHLLIVRDSAATDTRVDCAFTGQMIWTNNEKVMCVNS